MPPNMRSFAGLVVEIATHVRRQIAHGCALTQSQRIEIGDNRPTLARHELVGKARHETVPSRDDIVGSLGRESSDARFMQGRGRAVQHLRRHYAMTIAEETVTRRA